MHFASSIFAICLAQSSEGPTCLLPMPRPRSRSSAASSARAARTTPDVPPPQYLRGGAAASQNRANAASAPSPASSGVRTPRHIDDGSRKSENLALATCGGRVLVDEAALKRILGPRSKVTEALISNSFGAGSCDAIEAKRIMNPNNHATELAVTKALAKLTRRLFCRFPVYMFHIFLHVPDRDALTFAWAKLVLKRWGCVEAHRQSDDWPPCVFEFGDVLVSLRVQKVDHSFWADKLALGMKFWDKPFFVESK